MDGTFVNIDRATLATYTPVEGDQTPTPMFLRATATYTDKRGEQTAQEDSDNEVVANNDNRVPTFLDTETGMRSVDENTGAGTEFGAPVKATDPNSADLLTYTLGGTDMASFDIVRISGRLKTKAKLDYEIKNTYMVTVTATDPNGLSDSIDVTIKVTDKDEAPEIMRAPDANVAPEFASATTSRTVAENMVAGEDIGNPVAANDANGDALTYVLGGTDAASFDIKADTGQLMTKEALDYETKDSYEVMVTAEDSDGASDSIDVTVTVTNVAELGTVSGDATVSYAENGTDPVGTYTADGPDTATWTVSGADMDDFTIGADGMLMFVASPNYEAAADADTDNIYQVTVQADAGGEMDQVAVTVTVTDVDEMGTGDALVDRYDANSDGEIDRAEVGQAVRDFIGRQIEHDDVVQIIAQYFKDLRSES